VFDISSIVNFSSFFKIDFFLNYSFNACFAGNRALYIYIYKFVILLFNFYFIIK
jgi:hypothetical protein